LEPTHFHVLIINGNVVADAVVAVVAVVADAVVAVVAVVAVN